VRELNHLVIPIIDNCNQTGACRQYGLVLVRPPPIWIQLRNSSLGRRIKVDRKDLGELFNTQRPKRDGETLEETTGMISIGLIDLPQYSLVSLI
jgi:hypothetical protein